MAEIASPPTNITIVPATPNKGIKMGGEIKLGQPSTPAAVDPAKPGSFKEGMSNRLKQKAGLEPEKPPVTPPAKPNEPAPEKPETHPEPETPETAPATETPATATAPKEKVKPWKLVDEYKTKYQNAEQRAVAAESELELIRKGSFPKEVQERISKAEARAKELEDEIRFVSYEKSPEFKAKYQEPYEKAWARAVSEVKELTVNGPDGQPRAVGAEDILDLVNLPLGKARELANSLYGDFADDLMSHRKEIKTLFEQRTAALEEGKKNGAAREQQLREQHEKTYGEISSQVKEHWTKANEAAMADEKNGQFFKPVEGDEHWNQRLAKGFELVDRAFAENPTDPKLTTEQRAAVVRRHAAVRNRAAAFGPLKYKVGQLEATVAELRKELEQFKGSEPTVGDRKTTTGNGTPTSERDHVFSNLRKLAAK
jgi:hypothetical protein